MPTRAALRGCSGGPGRRRTLKWATSAYDTPALTKLSAQKLLLLIFALPRLSPLRVGSNAGALECQRACEGWPSALGCSHPVPPAHRSQHRIRDSRSSGTRSSCALTLRRRVGMGGPISLARGAARGAVQQGCTVPRPSPGDDRRPVLLVRSARLHAAACWGRATSRDFQDPMQKASERDLSPIFAEWVYGEQPHRSRMEANHP